MRCAFIVESSYLLRHHVLVFCFYFYSCVFAVVFVFVFNVDGGASPNLVKRQLDSLGYLRKNLPGSLMESFVIIDGQFRRIWLEEFAS